MAWSHYRDMIVWQKAMDLTNEIYRLAKLLPKEEQFSLSDQMRRAAVSVPSNIAEGHGRLSEKDFRHFLSVAKGSVNELQTQLYICVRQQFFTEKQAEEAFSLCDEVGKILTKLITAPPSKN